MSIRKALNVSTPSEIKRVVTGRYITLSKGNVSFTVSLREWNRLGLDVKVV